MEAATWMGEASVEKYDDTADNTSAARQRFVQKVKDHKDDGHLLILAQEAEKFRIGPIQTTLRFYDVFVENADLSISNLTLFPGGRDALKPQLVATRSPGWTSEAQRSPPGHSGTTTR